jgi:2-haloalkanoic acid dehalogenase type II
VFDVNETLSDMAPMAERFAEVGAPELAARLWFAVLLRDGFAVAAAGGNEPFAKLAEGALPVVLAGASLNRPTDEAAEHVLSGFAGLGVHPDVPEGMRILRRHGLRLVTLTNGSADVADGLLTRAGLCGEFERLLSAEDAAAWKPVPVNIDAELVVGVDANTISLANGCVCCQIRDDLTESVTALLARPETVEYIVLEASGVADPAGIFMTFSDPGLRDRIRLDSVTCVVDADQVFAHPEYPPLMDLKLRQVGFADMLILNKVSLAGPAQVAKVRAWLDGHFSRLRIVETDYCQVPY